MRLLQSLPAVSVQDRHRPAARQPRLVSLLEQGKRELTEEIRASYEDLSSKATDCTECGQCSKRCPFEVDVVGKMQEAVALFG